MMKNPTSWLLQASAIALIASTALVSSAMAKAPASCPAIEVASLAQPGGGAPRIFPGPNKASVAVEKASIVTVRDVIKADTSYAEGAWGLGLQLSPEAAKRIRAYTTAHVGDQLVFIVQGKAKMVAKILDPIMGDGVWISPMDKREADSLAVNVNACAARMR